MEDENTQTPTDTGPGPFSKLVEREWQSILDKDDRNSPEEYPEMVLLTHNEFAGAMTEAWLLARDAAPSQPTLTPRIAGQFDTFQHWVNHASSWLTREVDSNGYPLSAMCVDAKGRRCSNGRDFMRARDEDAFPVVFFWDCEVGS